MWQNEINYEKNGQGPNNNKNVKSSYLVVSETENHNLTHKTAIKIQFFSGTKSQSFFADTNLKIDQINRENSSKVQ